MRESIWDAGHMMSRLIPLALFFIGWAPISNSTLPSNFYQPGGGVFFEIWLDSGNKLDRIANYDCPDYASNGERFEYAFVYPQKEQSGRFRAFFVSNITGTHKFFAVINDKARLYIDLKPKGPKMIMDAVQGTDDDWSSRKWSQEVDLMEGFRYELTAYFYGDGENLEYFRLGVKFPDQSEVMPISKEFLWRSLGFYKWNGLLAHKYDNFQYPSSQKYYTLATAYSMNPSYPKNVSSYKCKKTLFDSTLSKYDYYALRYIGYMSFPVNGSFAFRMLCNEMCEFLLTKDNVEASIGNYNDNWAQSSNMYWVDMDGGKLNQLDWYPIKVFMTDSYGYDYIRIAYSIDSGPQSSLWKGNLTNLLPVEVRKRIMAPLPTMVNSTAISVLLQSTPVLPPRDAWASIQKNEVFFKRYQVDEPAKKIAVLEALPRTVIAADLNKYTEYVFYAHYFGNITGKDHNIITSYSVVCRTDEDVPEYAPPGLSAKRRSSTSIYAKWGTLTNLKDWNGIPVGYEVRYKEKNLTNNWNSTSISGSETRRYFAQDLKKYTFYEIKVAARTSKGSGPFSATVEERTMEDVPSAGPSNLTAQNTSSSSIHVEWNDVPTNHQNGIIIGHRLYIRKAGSQGTWMTNDVTSKSFSKTGLDLWTFYDVKVSAKTSVGEGSQSDVVRVRTDEDVPSEAPNDITVASLSAKALNVSWSDIIEGARHGVVASYSVKYKRTDGFGGQMQAIVTDKQAVLNGLASNQKYDINVAGMTRRGVGIYSSTIVFKTIESAPDAPPRSISGCCINSTAITVLWDVVPEEQRNGIIVLYTIQYKPKGRLSRWQELSVTGTLLTARIGNLEHYTMYQCRIAASNRGGRGPYSNIIDIRTDAGAPSRPPMNLTGHFLNETAIEIQWRRVPKEFRNGIIVGYKLDYKDKTVPGGPWLTITVPNRHNGSDVFNQTIAGLKKYTPYLFRIQAFTYRADGVLSENVTIWTDEGVPEGVARNVSGGNGSSTEIILRWSDMKEIHGVVNGKVLGYTVRYRVLDCHEDRPVGCSESQVFNVTANGNFTEIRIQKLRKYTSYSLSVQVFNIKGRGNFSKMSNVTTDEDKPATPPRFVEAWPSKINSIMVYWSTLLESLRNGIIIGYRIFYRPIHVPLYRYERAPRSVNDLAIYGAKIGEKMVEVNGSTYKTEIRDLDLYSWYQLRIGALTSKGLGPTIAVEGTTRQLSPLASPDLQVIDMYGFEEVMLKWNAVSKSKRRGEVLGYRIQYWLSELHAFPVQSLNKLTIDVMEPNRTITITGLQPYARYRFQILAFTEGGFGIWSQIHDGETCRCLETLTSALVSLPPLVNPDSLGVLPSLMAEAITSCCGNCSGKHGTTSVNWSRDSNGSHAMKYGKTEVIEALAKGTDIGLPVFSDFAESSGDIEKSQYVIVPLVELRYLAVFASSLSEKELANAAASVVTYSISEQWPSLLISTTLIILAGILFWAFESGQNKEEFSNTYAKGTGSGIWLAYITMTTVGYGDLTPITKMGKFLGMVWMLIGLVLTSIVIGNISSIFAIEFVFAPSSFATEDAVITSEDTFFIVKKWYGEKTTIGNTSDGRFLQESLLSGNVSKVVLDIYSASTLKSYLNHPNIILEKVKRTRAAYGIALANEAKRIKGCVSKFVQENSRQALVNISDLTYLYQMENSRAESLMKHVGSPSSDVMETLTLYGSMILMGLVIIGAIYELGRFIRAREKVDTDAHIISKMVEGTYKGICDLEIRINSALKAMEESQARDRMILNKMQYAKYLALSNMYPNLHVFDPDLPQQKKYQEESKKDTSNEMEGSSGNVKLAVKYYDDDDNYDYDYDYDMPIDYKTDSF